MNTINMVKKKKKIVDKNTFLGIMVESFTVRSEAALNSTLKQFHPAFYNPDDPAYEFVTTLVVSGKCTSPPERKGDYYEITFRGTELHTGMHSLTLKDCQAKDEHGAPIYKPYRGDMIPVHESPKGIAILNKQRGENAWDSWICVKQELVRDMLITLANVTPTYLSIHELKSDRQRWIQSILLQTTDPLDE